MMHLVPILGLLQHARVGDGWRRGPFRYTVIAPLLSLEAGSSHAQTLRQQAVRNWSIPGSTRTRVAVNTIRDWIRIYRCHGFDRLLPKQCADASKTRRMDVETPAVKTIEALLAIKRADPGLGVRTVIREPPGIPRASPS